MSLPKIVMLVFVLSLLWDFIPIRNANTISLFNVYTIPNSRFLYGHRLETVRVLSLLECACYCSKTPGCGGYKFRNGTCQILQSAKNDPHGEKLERFKFTSYKIDQTKCGDVPGVANSERETKGNSPGDVTTFTCNTDYMPCHNKTTSVCQSTGQWENVTGLCGRFRWHSNVMYGGTVSSSNSNFSLPCGSASKLLATLLVTPMTTIKFSVNIMKGHDYIFHVAFRRDREMVIGMNTYSNNYWRTEKTIPFEYVPEKKLKLVVDMSNGFSRIRIDDVIEADYHCQISDPRAEYINIQKNVTVHMLQVTLN